MTGPARRYTAEHQPDVCRRWEGRLLACSCGFVCRQDVDMAAHVAHPDRDTFRLRPVPVRPQCHRCCAPLYGTGTLCAACSVNRVKVAA